MAELARHVVLSAGPYAAGGATLAMGLAAAQGLPNLAAAIVSFGVPAAAGAAAAVEAARERIRIGREREHNRFLFLYETDLRLRERNSLGVEILG